MIGFFHTGALRELAPGLADFLTGRMTKMRLLISPYLSQDDQGALQKGLTSEPEVLALRLEEVYGSARVDASALVRHTLECLAFLIASNRLVIKVVLVRGGLFHPKVWLFSDGVDFVAAHGSNNLTGAALTTNVEQVTVSRSWLGADQEKVVNRFLGMFHSIWQDVTPRTLRVYELPEAFRARIIRDNMPHRAPDANDFWSAWEQDARAGLVPTGTARVTVTTDKTSRRLILPPGLDYQRGDFAHQGRAVKAWEAAGRRGVLEMATGSGKTIAALVAATRVLDEARPLLLVIAAPYRPLLAQWAREVEKFSHTPVLPGSESSRGAKLERVSRAIRNLRLGVADLECLVISHELLKDDAFKEEIARYAGPSMIVGDEVHGLGTKSFLSSAPENFMFRLGLSATPVRQYDEIGTEGLAKYFGDVVFRFPLEEAIGKCLVPYEYHVHPVTLGSEEIEEWLELTSRLQSVGWKSDGKSLDGELPPEVLRLLTRRHKILEQANGKLSVLRGLFARSKANDVRHALVYTSDKGREQLDQVNRMLMDDLRLRVHQITQDETGNSDLTQDLIDGFARGDSIQVLTAMRVLDEGIDIPEVSTAYILASTTVERQWVQRRGRVLRKCARTNKQRAYVHDFLVLPPTERGPDYYGDEIVGILKGELSRIMAFAKTASNAAAPGGPLEIVQPLIHEYF